MNTLVDSDQLLEALKLGQHSAEVQNGGRPVVRIRLMPNQGYCAVDTTTPEISTTSLVTARCVQEQTGGGGLIVCPNTLAPFVSMCGSETEIELKPDGSAVFRATKPGVKAESVVPKIECSVSWKDLFSEEDSDSGFDCDSEQLKRAVTTAADWTNPTDGSGWAGSILIACSDDGSTVITGASRNSCMMCGVPDTVISKPFSASVPAHSLLQAVLKASAERLLSVQCKQDAGVVLLKTATFVASCALSAAKHPDFSEVVDKVRRLSTASISVDRERLLDVVSGFYGMCSGDRLETICISHGESEGRTAMSLAGRNKSGEAMAASIPYVVEPKPFNPIGLAIGKLKDRLRQMKSVAVEIQHSIEDPTTPLMINEDRDVFILCPMVPVVK